MVPDQWPSVSVCPRGSDDPGSDPLHTVVSIRGDHDPATRWFLSRTIAEAAHLDDTDIIVDLSGVTFMDASTIGVLVDAYNRLRADSRSLSLRAPSPLARRLFDVCELAFLIDGHPAQARPRVATALRSWVAVPASDRASDSEPSVTEQAPSPEPARATTPKPVEQAPSVPQYRTPS